MQPETLKLLADIRHAGAAILQFAPDITPQQYESDVLLRSLVERLHLRNLLDDVAAATNSTKP